MTKMYKYTRRKRWEQWYDFVIIPIVAIVFATVIFYFIVGLWTGSIQ